MNFSNMVGLWRYTPAQPEEVAGAVFSATVKHPTGAPSTPLESRLCVCGHTYFMHGDRAVALCGDAERGTREPGAPLWVMGLQCTCLGFREAHRA